MVLLDTDVAVAGKKIEPVNQVQQMHESKCYQASDGQMGCTSCHNPHSIPAVEQRLTFFRDACLECHQVDACDAPADTRAAQGDSCFECHMPARNTEKIAHISQTDHRILRDPAAKLTDSPPNAASKSSERLYPSLKFLWDTEDRLSEWEKQRALGMALWLISSGRTNQPPAEIVERLAPVFSAQPKDGAVATVLGAFWSQYQDWNRARYYLEASLEDPSVRETSLSSLLNVYYSTAEWRKAWDVSNELLEIDPLNPRVHALRADIFLNFDDFENATSSAEKALELDPTLVSVRQWLAQLYERAGQSEKAREHVRFLERMQTATVPAASEDSSDAKQETLGVPKE